MNRLGAVLTLLALNGCGPFLSTRDLLDAEVQIEAARTAGAEKLAPYELTAAKLYLHKAREVVGHSDYEAGVAFAGKASKYAREAKNRSVNAESKSDLVAPPKEPLKKTESQ